MNKGTIKYIPAEEALRSVKSGERIFIHGGAATPDKLVNALTARYRELENVEIVHIHTEGEAPYARAEYSDTFILNSFFIGNNIRADLERSNIQYVPVFLSEVPALFRRGLMPLDTALIQVSEPDNHGFCSLGVSIDIAKAATETAKKIIALVNPNMPRSHGDGQIHVRRFHSAVYCTEPIHEVTIKAPDNIEMAIWKNISLLIKDGATLQFGIGGNPSAVCNYLSGHKNLGVHTEMFTDALLALVESGVINGLKKKKHPCKIPNRNCTPRSQRRIGETGIRSS